jgi:hypothetical protein
MTQVNELVRRLGASCLASAANGVLQSRKMVARGSRSQGRKRLCGWCGAVAQMGERCNRTAEVRGSIPLSSTSRRRRERTRHISAARLHFHCGRWVASSLHNAATVGASASSACNRSYHGAMFGAVEESPSSRKRVAIQRERKLSSSVQIRLMRPLGRGARRQTLTRPVSVASQKIAPMSSAINRSIEGRRADKSRSFSPIGNRACAASTNAATAGS